MKINKISLIVLTIIVVLILSAAALSYFTKLSNLESFRIVFGSIYVLFLPGFIISYIFFPKTGSLDNKNEKDSGSIDWLERIALSFALSIAVVPLAVFYLNLIGVKINLLNSFLTILAIILISSWILYWRNKKNISSKV